MAWTTAGRYAYCLAAHKYADLRPGLLAAAGRGIDFMTEHFWQVRGWCPHCPMASSD